MIINYITIWNWSVGWKIKHDAIIIITHIAITNVYTITKINIYPRRATNIEYIHISYFKITAIYKYDLTCISIQLNILSIFVIQQWFSIYSIIIDIMDKMWQLKPISNCNILPNNNSIIEEGAIKNWIVGRWVERDACSIVLYIAIENWIVGREVKRDTIIIIAYVTIKNWSIGWN